MKGPRIFALVMAAAAIAALVFSFRSPFSRAVTEEKPVFGLLIGTDWVDNARHADTIVLLRYQPHDRSLDVLSIPRDTRIDFPGLRVRRINEIYTYAFKTHNKNHEAASRALVDAVRWLIFVSSKSAADPAAQLAAVPAIPYYAQVDYEGFKKMIDLLGGIPVTIDQPMHYDDNWGKLHIHFEPGQYVLSGQKALEYVRFRGMSGDIGRMSRQQEFLLNILARFRHPLNILKLPQILSVSLASFKTNLSWYERLLVLLELKDLSTGRIRLMQLPGESKAGYLIPDPAGVAATAFVLTGGSSKPAQVLGEALAPASEDASAESAPAVPAKRTTIEVWNASSHKGLALEVVRQLRQAGFDVVKWGNYSSRQLRTLVRDHRGDIEEARRIAGALSSPRVEVFTRVESNPLVDVEVILGEDYKQTEK